MSLEKAPPCSGIPLRASGQERSRWHSSDGIFGYSFLKGTGKSGKSMNIFANTMFWPEILHHALTIARIIYFWILVIVVMISSCPELFIHDHFVNPNELLLSLILITILPLLLDVWRVPYHLCSLCPKLFLMFYEHWVIDTPFHPLVNYHYSSLAICGLYCACYLIFKFFVISSSDTPKYHAGWRHCITLIHHFKSP